MKRFTEFLRSKVIKGKAISGAQIEKPITMSIGIAACSAPIEIEQHFEFAEKALLKSKNGGKDRITRYERMSVEK